MFFQTANHSTEANEVVDYYFADLGISVTASIISEKTYRRPQSFLSNDRGTDSG